MGFVGMGNVGMGNVGMGNAAEAALSALGGGRAVATRLAVGAMRARPGRVAAALAAVSLGVMLLSGALVLGDTLRAVGESSMAPGRATLLRGALGAIETAAVLAAWSAIHHVFAATAAPCLREASVLRTIGASRVQVAAPMAVQALVIGSIGTLAGLAGGIGFAELLVRALDPTPHGLVITSGAFAVAAPVGPLAALTSAVRAAGAAPSAPRVPGAEGGVSEARVLVGTATGLVAAGAVVWGGLAGTPAVAEAGAVMLLGAVLLLGPVAARPAVAFAGAAAAGLGGLPGALARGAASRSPRRTAGAATALMAVIGAATMATVVAGSLRASLERDAAGSAQGVVAASARPHGAPPVENRDAATSSADLEAMLGAVDAMLALAVVIAALGAAGALAVGVRERAREIGLLRTVGATGAQVAAMVRWEALIVAVFGTVGGAGLGLLVGWALTGALQQPFAAPPARLAAVALAGVLTAVPAALPPARRAARRAVRDAAAE
ncbi:UNVERIFIED_ORG: FtsX-like permease family protein [Actinomadura viridilutea]|nr:FtsX-like permease family protein [Actinomadura rubrobrunea]